MLAVEDPRVICLRVVLVHVLELPGNTDLLIARREGKVLALVDETTCGIATEQVGKIEAATYDWNARSGEGQGVGRIVITACLLRAVWKEA